MSARALVTLGGGYANVILATPVISALRALGYTVDALVESHQPDAATLLGGWDALDSIFLTRRSLRQSECTRGYRWVVRTTWNRGSPIHLGEELRPLAPAAAHEVEQNLSALRPLGWTGEPVFRIACDEFHRTPPERFLAVAPGWRGVGKRRMRRKAWKGWNEFCDAWYARTGVDVVVLGVEEDNARWMRRIGRSWLQSYCGQTSFREAAGLIAHCAGLVAVDNALAHVGAALGKPVTVLFGPTDERRQAPRGAGVRLLASDRPCRPCRGARGPACSNECMSDLTVDQVLAAVAPQELAHAS